jgi:integrase
MDEMSAIGSGPVTVASLAPVHVRAWRSAALSRLKPASINQRLAFLRKYVRWAADSGHIPAAHADAIRQVEDVQTPKLAAKSLDAGDYRRLVSAVESHGTSRDRALVFLMLNGLRVGEVVGLRRVDVTLNAHRASVEIRGEHVKFSATRTVALNKQVRVHLERYLREAPTSGPLFPGDNGALTVGAAFRVVKKYGSMAGVSVHPHQLRHTFARMFLAATHNDLCGLQALLGHSRLDVTAKHYARKSMADLEAGVDSMTL